MSASSLIGRRGRRQGPITRAWCDDLPDFSELTLSHPFQAVNLQSADSDKFLPRCPNRSKAAVEASGPFVRSTSTADVAPQSQPRPEVSPAPPRFFRPTFSQLR